MSNPFLEPLLYNQSPNPSSLVHTVLREQVLYTHLLGKKNKTMVFYFTQILSPMFSSTLCTEAEFLVSVPQAKLFFSYKIHRRKMLISRDIQKNMSTVVCLQWKLPKIILGVLYQCTWTDECVRTQDSHFQDLLEIFF